MNENHHGNNSNNISFRNDYFFKLSDFQKKRIIA